MLLMFRALVGVGEGSYGPAANALLCAVARPREQGRALGIYNAGMAIGGSTGLCLGAILAPMVGWRGVFWIAGAPSLLLALLCAFIRAPKKLVRPHAVRVRGYRFLLAPAFIMALCGGILVTFASSGLLFWASWLIIKERHFSNVGGALLMGALGTVFGITGVIAGGITGDVVARRQVGGHARVMGTSLLLAIPSGLGCLLVANKPAFAVLTGMSVFLLSAYNGPAAVVVDQLAPANRAATMQAIFMFGVHVLGDAPAGAVVGFIGGFTTIAHALLITVAAYGVAGFLLVAVARRQRREAPAIEGTVWNQT
jgi:MFS family permease